MDDERILRTDSLLVYNKIQFQENLIDELVAYVTAKAGAIRLISTSALTAASSMKSSMKPISTAGSSRASTMPEGRYAALVLDAAGDDAENSML